MREKPKARADLIFGTLTYYETTKNMVAQIQVWLAEHPGLAVFEGMRFLKASRLKADILSQYELVEAAVNDALGAQADAEEDSDEGEES